MDLYRKRLLYKATHRGMKETDTLIGGFAKAQLEFLSDVQLASFDALLDEEDNDLLNWIMEREDAPKRIDSQLLNQIITFNGGL